MSWSIKGIAGVLLASGVLMPLLVSPPHLSASPGVNESRSPAPAPAVSAPRPMPFVHPRARYASFVCAPALESLALLAH